MPYMFYNCLNIVSYIPILQTQPYYNYGLNKANINQYDSIIMQAKEPSKHSSMGRASQFVLNLKNSPMNTNPCYLGFLLLSTVSSGDQKIEEIRALIKYGADVNFKQMPQNGQRGPSVLMVACQMSVAPNVKQLLRNERLDVGVCDNSNNNALHYALRNESEDEAICILECILKQFPHLITCSPKPFLFSVIDSRKLKLLAFLLSKSYVSANEQHEPIGLTSLQYCISLSNQLPSSYLQNAVVVLLKFGGDPNRQNFLSENAYDYAQKYLYDIEQLVRNVEKEGVPLVGKKSAQSSTSCTMTYEDSKASLGRAQQDDVDFNEFEMQKKQQCGSNDIWGQSEGKEILNQAQAQEFQKNSLDQQDSQNQQQSRNNFYLNFSSQIYQFSILSTQVFEQAQFDISPLYNFLELLGKQLDLKLEVIGSFATGLWTAHSDIDLVYINEKSAYVDIVRLLKHIWQALWENRGDYNRQQNGELLGIEEVYLNTDTKFPNIKIKLNENKNNRKLEIGIFQRKCSGRKYVQYICEWVQSYPHIMPVFFSLHKLLQGFNLHRPTKNGIKTYTIFLMIISQIQILNSIPLQGQVFLSSILIQLVHYYSEQEIYQYCLDKEQKQPKAVLNIMDPLNTANNTGGKETDTVKLIIMFKAAKAVILQAMQQGKATGLLHTLVELHRMFQ